MFINKSYLFMCMKVHERCLTTKSNAIKEDISIFCHNIQVTNVPRQRFKSIFSNNSTYLFIDIKCLFYWKEILKLYIRNWLNVYFLMNVISLISKTNQNYRYFSIHFNTNVSNWITFFCKFYCRINTLLVYWR
jgi:hypothetical protein